MPRPQRKKPPPADIKVNPQSNARRVISVPELIALIVHELDNNEQRKLMHISKHFFHLVGPIAWRSIPRLDIILRLIRGARVKTSYSLGPYKYRFITTFQPRLNLSRYDIYTPWIQELDIYGGCYQEIINPDSFLALFEGQPPLPNLRRLTAYTSAPIGEDDLMGFFNMFIGPSLTDIRTIIPNEGFPKVSGSRVPSSSVPVFIEKIRKTCPQIQVLEFYPTEAYASIWSERYLPNGQSLNALASFVNLRSFGSTTYILEPAILAILGELPHLESLGIRGATTERSILDTQLSVPDTWFPALKHLRLYDIDAEDMQIIWSQPAIVKKLTSALIQIDVMSPRYANDHPLRRKNWITPFLEGFSRLSPRLQDVALYMGSWDRRIEIPRGHWKFLGVDKDIYYAFLDYKVALYKFSQRASVP